MSDTAIMAVQSDPSSGSTRREWLTGVSAATSASSAAPAQTGGNLKRPNIVLIISDQFRWDCVGAMGLSPMNLTPNLDAMAMEAGITNRVWELSEMLAAS
jgi:hypothetical protein